jgi:hypothetical protein
MEPLLCVELMGLLTLEDNSQKLSVWLFSNRCLAREGRQRMKKKSQAVQSIALIVFATISSSLTDQCSVTGSALNLTLHIHFCMLFCGVMFLLTSVLRPKAYANDSKTLIGEVRWKLLSNIGRKSLSNRRRRTLQYRKCLRRKKPS